MWLASFNPGRSYYELAVLHTKTGCPSLPPELRHILNSHDDTKGVVIESGKLFRKTLLPCSPRGFFHHHVSFDESSLPLFITFEATDDESSWNSVENELLTAFQRRDTDFPERLAEMTEYVLEIPLFRDLQRKDLNPVMQRVPYRLLSGVRPNLLEAKDRAPSKAIFIVHESWTAKTSLAKMQSASKALDSFLRLLLKVKGETHEEFELETGRLLRFPHGTLRFILGRSGPTCCPKLNAKTCISRRKRGETNDHT